MQRRASSWNGAVMACVGQAVMQRVQEPQRFFSGASGFQFQGRQDFGEENPVAKFAADDVGVFADKAQAGALGEIAFEHRAGVHIPKRARVCAAEFIHEWRSTISSVRPARRGSR